VGTTRTFGLLLHDDDVLVLNNFLDSIIIIIIITISEHKEDLDILDIELQLSVRPIWSIRPTTNNTLPSAVVDSGMNVMT
jgi:hypothetical protein